MVRRRVATEKVRVAVGLSATDNWPCVKRMDSQRPRDFRQGRLLDLSHGDVAGSVVDCGRTTIRRVAMGIKSAAVDS